jgi:hypothetical protein
VRFPFAAEEQSRAEEQREQRASRKKHFAEPSGALISKAMTLPVRCDPASIYRELRHEGVK